MDIKLYLIFKGNIKKANIKIYIGGTKKEILLNENLNNFLKFGDEEHKKEGVIEAKAKKIFLHPDLGTTEVRIELYQFFYYHFNGKDSIQFNCNST